VVVAVLSSRQSIEIQRGVGEKNRQFPFSQIGSKTVKRDRSEQIASAPLNPLRLM